MRFLISIFVLILIENLFFSGSTMGKEVIEIDQTAPEVNYTPKSDSIEAGKAIEISLQATDNQKLARVTLFYRNRGEGEYRSVEMVNTDHDHYAYLIPGGEIYGDRLEYYFLAEDDAGNRTMKGFSATPFFLKIFLAESPTAKKSKSLSPATSLNRTALQKSSGLKNAVALYLGESVFRLSDQGNQMVIPSFSYGVEGEFQYQPGFEVDIGITGSHADSIKNNWILFQNLSGTLYETLDVLSIHIGQRFRQKERSFLIAINYLTARLSDRNLLNSSGLRITRFPDENFNQVGLTLGFGWNYLISDRVGIGIDPKINLFFSGQLSHLTFPIEIHYAF